MSIEYELKFRATRETLQEILASIPGEDQHYYMQTTYFDTPSGQLSRRHYTLRRRLENYNSVYTLKVPAAVGRNEWETECDLIDDAIEELCKLGAPAELPSLMAEGIVAICGARFQRTARTVRLEDGVLELAIDEGVLTGGYRELPLCEVEVELKIGSIDCCNRFAQTLAACFNLQPEPQSKFSRAFALRQGE